MSSTNNDNKIITEIKSAIRFSLSKSEDQIFESICDRIQCYFERASTSMLELKKNNTKTKGLIFEIFCKLYLLNRYEYKEVWLLSEVPSEILEALHLKSFDMGIDLIALSKYNKYSAIQCKYRIAPNNKKKNVLSWKQLSTFYSLCSKTGPFEKHIVMTNCDYIRRMGIKDEKDWSICYTTFKNTERKIWSKILGDTGYVLGCEMKGTTELKEISNEKKSDITNTEDKILKEKEQIEEIKKDQKNLRNLRSNFLDKLKSK
jgi:hypothetical protein